MRRRPLKELRQLVCPHCRKRHSSMADALSCKNWACYRHEVMQDKVTLAMVKRMYAYLYGGD